MSDGRSTIVIIDDMGAKRGQAVSTGEVHYGPPVGPGVSVASPAEVAAALEDMPAPDDWVAMASGILPLFERRRPFPFDVGHPIRAVLPPGLSVTIGYDFGPGHLRITRELAEAWPVTEEEILARAMSNLRRRVRSALAGAVPPRLVNDTVDGIPIRAMTSGQGWASTMLLVPDLLGRLWGRERCLFIAPMRDLLIALPADVDTRTATMWAERFEAVDPNCLCLEAFAWDGSRLTISLLAREVATA